MKIEKTSQFSIKISFEIEEEIKNRSFFKTTWFFSLSTDFSFKIQILNQKR
jgi:hypothetical protein